MPAEVVVVVGEAGSPAPRTECHVRQPNLLLPNGPVVGTWKAGGQGAGRGRQGRRQSVCLWWEVGEAKVSYTGSCPVLSVFLMHLWACHVDLTRDWSHVQGVGVGGMGWCGRLRYI